jgi:hypothetical protein
VLSARNAACLDQGAHFGGIFQGTDPVSESEFIRNDTAVVRELSIWAAAAGKYPVPPQDVHRIELLAGKCRREFTHRGRSFLVAQSRACENELQAAPIVPFLESAHQKSYVNSLSPRIGVRLVQHNEPKSIVVKNLGVSRPEQQVLQHREIR